MSWRARVVGGMVAVRVLAGCISDEKLGPLTDAGRPSAGPLADAGPDVTTADVATPGLDGATARLVFVSSAEVNGSVDADLQCDTLGRNARPAGRFVAWTPRAASSGPITKLPSDGVWADSKGVVVASYDELRRGELRRALSFDESGGPIDGSDAFVWTGAKADGTTANEHCSFFTTSESFPKGQVGNWQQTTGGQWSSAMAVSCAEKHHLLCFEL